MIDPTQPSVGRKLPVDIKTILLVILALAFGLLLGDRWHAGDRGSSKDDRTVSVTGEATLKATPDEFVFYPSYEFKNGDKAAGLAELTKKSDEIVAQLKKLGVADSKIKTATSGGDSGPISYAAPTDPGMVPDTKTTSYNLQLTVTVADKDMAQKVQTYLVTTSPIGQVSPQPSFSDAKRKSLEAKARDQATQDARSKADQSAKNLGFTVDKVKSVDDGSGFGVYSRGKIAPMAADGATSSAASSPELAIQPGENDINYSVTVVYTIK